MDIQLPIELWSIIGSYLPVADKCTVISLCRATQAQLYNDPFWLEFALTNLLRGLTMEEVIILTFSKANPDRLAKSRISKFKNFLTQRMDDSMHIEKTLEDELSLRSASAIYIGDLPSSFARHFAFHRFALNFIALFCTVTTFISPSASAEELRRLVKLQKQNIKSLDSTEVLYYLGRLYRHLNLYSLSCELITDEELEVIRLHSTAIRELKLKVNATKLERQSKIIGRMTSLENLTLSPASRDGVIPYSAVSAIVGSIGSTLQNIDIKCDEKAFLEGLALHCRQLDTLKLNRFGPNNNNFDNYLHFNRLAEQCPSFPKELNFRCNPNESGTKFFRQYGSRLKTLCISDVVHSQLKDLIFAANLEELDLRMDSKEKDYEATLQQTIENFSRLRSLLLCVHIEQPFLIKNSHLTSVDISAENLTLDTPELTSAALYLHSLSINSCNLTSLQILRLTDPVNFGKMNVDWYKIKRLVASENRTFWRLITDFVPADTKFHYLNGIDITFQLNQKPALLPRSAKIKWPVIESQLFKEATPFMNPKRLELHRPLFDKPAVYETFTEKFPVLEQLVLSSCDSITINDVDVLITGLKKLKIFGMIDRRKPLPLLKIHSESLELLFLNKVLSIESSDIVCPNLCTITFYIVGLTNHQFSSGFCERTLMQLTETNSCPKLSTFHAVAYDEKDFDDDDALDDSKDTPSQLLKLVNVPASLQYLRLKRASHFHAIAIVSDNLGGINLSECNNLKSLRIKAPLVQFTCRNMRNFQRLTIESKIMHQLELESSTLSLAKLLTPQLHELIVCEPTARSLVDNLVDLRHLEITANDPFRVPEALLARLSSACPKLKSLKLGEKCAASSSALHALKKSYKSERGSKIELICDTQLLRGIANLEAKQKLPEKKQKMMRINAFMKRTIINWKFQLKAKAFRSWRDLALKKNKKQ